MTRPRLDKLLTVGMPLLYLMSKRTKCPNYSYVRGGKNNGTRHTYATYLVDALSAVLNRAP
jgi:hypothetical protein